MSGFRKFRTALHRRRRSIEAAELGLITGPGAGPPAGDAEPAAAGRPEIAPGTDADTAPLEFSPSAEAVEIGPTPISWMKGKRLETDH